MLVDLTFQQQERLPSGFEAYAAISHALPDLHDTHSWAMHPIHGGTLRLRCDSHFRESLLRLDGTRLFADTSRLQYRGESVVRPSTQLRCEQVLIKPSRVKPADITVEVFSRCAEKQLRRHAESGALTVEAKRRIWIHRRCMVGYAVSVRELSDDDSLSLQRHGMGGRKHFGCGVFVPC